MAFLPHTLLSFRGTMGASGSVNEIWSFGLRIAGTDAPNDTTTVDPAGMHTAAGAIHDLFVYEDTFLDNVKAVEVRGYRIDAAGHARGPVTISGFSLPYSGSATTNRHPWQCTNVVSLIHDGVGPGRKGRVYLPPQGIPVDDSGHISDAAAGTLRGHFATFLDTIVSPAYEGTTTRLVVASKTHGTLKDVNRLRVGRVTDTQRRRRNKELELYNEGVWPG